MWLGWGRFCNFDFGSVSAAKTAVSVLVVRRTSFCDEEYKFWVIKETKLSKKPSNFDGFGLLISKKVLTKSP